MTDKIPIRSPVRAVITTCEVNDSHGTGVTVKRIVGSTPNVLSIRSMDLYGGNHDFGHISVRLTQRGLSKHEAVQNTIRTLGGCDVRQVYCVP